MTINNTLEFLPSYYVFSLDKFNRFTTLKTAIHVVYSGVTWVSSVRVKASIAPPNQWAVRTPRIPSTSPEFCAQGNRPDGPAHATPLHSRCKKQKSKIILSN